jgi:dolichyl-phosphate beta-glucosyltransferase
VIAEKDKKVFLSIVIPAYNEEKRITSTIERIIEYVHERALASEIIVVDDGSTDKTDQVVEEISQKNQFPIKILKNEQNMGKGFTVKKGALAALGEYILFSDSDMSTPIEEFDKMLPLLTNDCDVTIGSRAMKNSDIQIRQVWYREGMGKIFNFFVQLLVFQGIKDTQCGFKAFRHDPAKRIFSKVTVNRFGFDVEVLFLAKMLKLKIGEVPIKWLNSPASRVRCVTDSLNMFSSLVQIRLNKIKGLYKGL